MIDVGYDTNEGLCSVQLSPCGLLFEDDFTQANGSPNGWTPRTGYTWTVYNNELRTTSDSRITPDAFGFGHDFSSA